MVLFPDRALLSAILSVALCTTALANPAGEHIVAGQATFTRATDNLTVTQQSQNAIVDWQQFSIGAGETTRFVQPNSSAAILNRVVGNDLSAIYGTLQANGQVYLINPNGVVVGPQGTINTASFTASTLDVTDAAFLNGGDLTFSGGSIAGITNLGTIEAINGNVTLIGRDIVNSGHLTAAHGNVALAAGSDIVMHPNGSNVVGILAGSAAGTLANSGLIEATTAELLAKGGNANALAINTTGVIRTNGITQQDGRIILAGGDGDVNVSGELKAARGNDGGNITISGKRILVDDNARISADGANGGQILIGGGQEGLDAAIPNADRVYVAPTATISANGTAGNGGTVVLYSRDGTQAYGSLAARGSRNGGFIETSGGWLDFGDGVPDVWGAAAAGTWLIDPYNITIIAGNGNTNIGTTSPFTSTGDDAQLGVARILTALGTGNVIITTGSGGTQAGDLTLNTDLDFNGIGTSGRTLTLRATRNVVLNGTIYDSVAGGDLLNLTLTSDNDADGSGAVIFTKNISTGGGSIAVTRNSYLAGASALTLDSGTGNMTFSGQTQLANADGVTLTTNGGTILFSNLLNSGNSYAYDSTLRTWTAARTNAASGTGGGTGDTYLATITSALENSIALTTVPAGTSAWLGGSDAASEGAWRWVTGPEGLENSGAGRQFWQGTSTGAAVGSQYNNWATGQPDDAGANQDALQMTFGGAGQWSDAEDTVTTRGSIVETNLAPTNLTVNLGTGGTLTFSNVVGGERPIGNLTVNAGGTVNIANTFTAAGTVDLNSALNWNTASRIMTAAKLVFRQNVSGNASNVTFAADDMDLQGNINFGTNILTLRPRTDGNAIYLGTVGDTVASTLELSNAELGRITAGSLRVGTTTTGNIVITGAVDVPLVTNLRLTTGGTITDDPTGSLGTSALALVATGAIMLDSGHDVDTLALSNSTADSFFYDTDGFNIGTVDTLNGIGATGRNVTLKSNGAVTQSQNIQAIGLELLGTGGTYNLTGTGNFLTTLAGNTGSINYSDANSLIVDTVNSTAGIITTGSTQVRTLNGNLSIAQPVTAGGGGNSIVLVPFQHFINTANTGNGTLNPGTNGRYLIYTSNVASTQLNGMVEDGHLYNITFAANAPGTIGGTGNQVLYSFVPTLTFTVDTTTRTYGDTSPYTYTLTGLVNGDSAATALSSIPGIVAGGSNVGTHSLTANTGGITSPLGYTLSFVSGNVTFTAAPLTLYAQSLSREFLSDNPTLAYGATGLVNGDTLASLGAVNVATTATRDSAVGSYAINLTGGSNSNYTITRQNGTLTVAPLKTGEAVKEAMTTFANVPDKQASAPPDMPTQPSSGTAAMVIPLVSVAPMEMPLTNRGETMAQGSDGFAWAQSSSLDLIAEQNP